MQIDADSLNSTLRLIRRATSPAIPITPHRKTDSCAESPEIARSLFEVARQVEHTLDSCANQERFVAARNMWNELLAILNESADLILGMSDPRSQSSKLDSLDVEFQRISLVSKASSVVLSSKQSKGATDHSACSPVSTASRTEGEALSENGFNQTLARASVSIDSAMMVSNDRIIRERETVQSLIDVLHSQIDNQLDSFLMTDKVSDGHSSVEFALQSHPEELNQVGSLNTVKWLNDVLKWQVIDMKAHLRKNETRAENYVLLQSKKRILKDLCSSRLESSLSDTKHAILNYGLDAAICDMSRASTAPPSPDTAKPKTQMVRSVGSPECEPL